MNISSKKELEEAIIELEKKKAIQYGIMVNQYHETVESLSPKNLIRSAFSSISHSAEARSGILKTAAGLGIGFLTKRLFGGRSSSFLKKLLGNAIKIGVARTAINNADKIRAFSTAIYHNLFKKKSKQDH